MLKRQSRAGRQQQWALLQAGLGDAPVFCPACVFSVTVERSGGVSSGLPVKRAKDIWRPLYICITEPQAQIPVAVYRLASWLARPDAVLATLTGSSPDELWSYSAGRAIQKRDECR